MADGHLNKCKDCKKAYQQRYFNENREAIRAYDKARGMLPHRVAARKAYQQTEAGKLAVRRANKKWKESNADKRAAHILLGNAVRSGRVVKPDSCSQCGANGRLHGHHEDYAKPLEVIWVCSPCHTKIHKAF